MTRFGTGVSWAPSGSLSSTYSDKAEDTDRNLYSVRVFSISNLNEWTGIDKEELIDGAAPTLTFLLERVILHPVVILVSKIAYRIPFNNYPIICSHSLCWLVLQFKKVYECASYFRYVKMSTIHTIGISLVQFIQIGLSNIYILVCYLITLI